MRRINLSQVSKLIFGFAMLLTLGLGVCCVKAGALNIAQGYHTSDSSIGVGMAVSMSNDSTPENPTVELSKRGNLEKFVGIVTTVDETLLSFPERNSNVLVANSGDVTAFMTDISGQVKKGDTLTISPLAGMLMKASDDDTFVVGTAIEDANSTVDTKEIHTDQNNTKTVVVSSQKVNLQPHFRQVLTKKSESSFLVIFGESITGGKSVSQTQVIVALLLFFITLAVEGSIIYGAVQSSISAIGRNPLAKKAVYKQLLQVSWISLLILTFGFGAIALVLWI